MVSVNIPDELQGILSQKADTMSGAVCFKNTRIPVQILLDTLYCGDTIDDFLDGFPDISRDQAQAIVKWEQKQARVVFGIEALT